MTEYRWMNDEYKKIPSSKSEGIDVVNAYACGIIEKETARRLMGLSSWNISDHTTHENYTQVLTHPISFEPTKCSSCGRKLTDGECIKGCGATQ